MDSDEQVNSPFPIATTGFTAGCSVELPDREVSFPWPIRSVTIYGQRVLVRCSYTELLDVVDARPLTKVGFQEAFPDYVPVAGSIYMVAALFKGSRIGLVTDDLGAFITRDDHVAHVPEDAFSVKEVLDGYAVLTLRDRYDARNLYFYNADGSQRWRVGENPFVDAPKFQFSYVEVDSMGRLIGKMDWRIRQEFAIDSDTGEIVEQIRC